MPQVDSSTAQDLLCVANDPVGEKATHAWAPSHRRLLGWVRYRFRKNATTIWHRLRFEDFHAVTGLSLRSFRNAIDRLREEQDDHGLKFRTVWRHGKGRTGSWVVLVSEAEQLLFDKEPLFRTEDGRNRHIRPQQRQGEIPRPTRQEAPQRLRNGRIWPSKASRGESRGKGANVSATPYKGSTQQIADPNTAKAGSGREPPINGPPPRPPWVRKPISQQGRRRLRAKAGFVAETLEFEHWDACRIDFEREAVAGWVYAQLRTGHGEPKIRKAYRRGLKHAHSWAVDKESHKFTPASTLAEASRVLDRDRRTEAERVAVIYDERRVAYRAFREALEAGEPLKPPF